MSVSSKKIYSLLDHQETIGGLSTPPILDGSLRHLYALVMEGWLNLTGVDMSDSTTPTKRIGRTSSTSD